MPHTSLRLRSWTGVLGTFLPGNTPAHRAPVWSKLCVLVAVSVLLTVVHSLALALSALLAATALVWWVGMPPTRLLLASWTVLVALAPIAGFGWWQHGWSRGVEVPIDLLATIVLAIALTITTRADTLVDALVRGARPLRALGVRPERLAMVVALMLRAVPSLLDTMSEVRDAALARGLTRSPRAYLVPFTLRAVGRAHTTAEALDARGLTDV